MAASTAPFWQKFYHRMGTTPARFRAEVLQQRLDHFCLTRGLDPEVKFLQAAEAQPELWPQLHQALLTVESPEVPRAASLEALRQGLPLLVGQVPEGHPCRVLIVGQGDLSWAQLLLLLLQETLFPDPAQAWEVLAVDASYAAVSQARPLGAPAPWWKALPLDPSPLEFNPAGFLQPEASLAQRLQFLTYDLLALPPLENFHLAILLDEARHLTPQALSALAHKLAGSLLPGCGLWAPALTGHSPQQFLQPLPEVPQAWQVHPPKPAPSPPQPAQPLAQESLGPEAIRLPASYQNLIETSPFPIVIHSEDRYLYANPATLQLFGIQSLATLQAMPLLDLLPEEEVSLARKMIQNIMEGQVITQPVRHFLRLPNRQTKQVAMVGTRIIYQEQWAIQLVIYDLTQQNEAEQEVWELNHQLESRIKARTEALEDSNRELERFAFSVSHDLRAPLRHLISYTTLLERRAKEQLTPDTLDFLHFISAAAHKMNLLIENLLTYSRIGRKTLARCWIDLPELITEIRAVLVASPAASPIEWKIGALPPLYGDPILIEQVFMNLLSNAIKYSSREPSPHIEIGGRQQEDGTLYWIKDNGIGFDNEQREHIFGIFRRLFSEAEFEGTGIGLANVRRIMDRHEGKVWAHSSPEQGATFFLHFPPKVNGEPGE